MTRPTILIVEDQPALRRVAERILVRVGYPVLTAESGEEALQVAGTHAERIGLLLTDLVMPGIGGRELARTLRRQRPELRVLYLSGYSEDGVFDADDVPGGFLQKPFSVDTLLAAVQSALES